MYSYETRKNRLKNEKVAYMVSSWVPTPKTAQNRGMFGGCLKTSP